MKKFLNMNKLDQESILVCNIAYEEVIQEEKICKEEEERVKRGELTYFEMLRLREMRHQTRAIQAQTEAIIRRYTHHY